MENFKDLAKMSQMMNVTFGSDNDVVQVCSYFFCTALHCPREDRVNSKSHKGVMTAVFDVSSSAVDIQ